MKAYDWEIAKNKFCEGAYDYLLRVHKKNIQPEDFVRGYASLPHKHCSSSYSHSRHEALLLYFELREEYGFFNKENFE